MMTSMAESRQRIFSRLQRTILLCGIALLIISSKVCAASSTVGVTFVTLESYEDTYGWGADEIYILSLAVNLQSSAIDVQLWVHPHVCEGDVIYAPRQFAYWPGVENPDDVILMVMVVEQDEFMFPAYMLMEPWLKDQGANYIGQFIPLYRDGRRTRDQMRQIVRDQMMRAMKYGWDADDALIKLFEVPIFPHMLGNTQYLSRGQYHYITGHGGRFMLSFAIESWPELTRQTQTYVVDEYYELASIDAEMQQDDSREFEQVDWSELTQPHDVTAYEDESLTGYGSATRLASLLGPPPELDGSWTSSLGIEYEVFQFGDEFFWYCEALNEYGFGSLPTGRHMLADWFGDWGIGSGQALVGVDAAGRAAEILWSDGTIFHR